MGAKERGAFPTPGVYAWAEARLIFAFQPNNEVFDDVWVRLKPTGEANSSPIYSKQGAARWIE